MDINNIAMMIAANWPLIPSLMSVRIECAESVKPTPVGKNKFGRNHPLLCDTGFFSALNISLTVEQND
jgi:hypothetical protein